MNHSFVPLLAACALALLIWPQSGRADPEDPLGQLIRQRQQQPASPPPGAAEPDREALDALIREKTAASAEPPKAAAAPGRSSVSSGTAKRSDADDLIAGAMGFLGVAYRFGGVSPSGFDCSGFMQYIFKRTYAVNLPRTSAEQATIGVHVNRADLQPGDMVFFRTAGSRISHVGMYVGNNRFIHAPRTGKNIEITSLSNKYWDSRYATARRVKRNNAQDFIRK